MLRREGGTSKGRKKTPFERTQEKETQQSCPPRGKTGLNGTGNDDHLPLDKKGGRKTLHHSGRNTVVRGGEKHSPFYFGGKRGEMLLNASSTAEFVGKKKVRPGRVRTVVLNDERRKREGETARHHSTAKRLCGRRKSSPSHDFEKRGVPLQHSKRE